MNGPLLQLLVLGGIAVFLIFKLKGLLGTREGFEKPAAPPPLPGTGPARKGFEVIDGGQDRDITDFAAPGSNAAEALALMKRAEPSFRVGEFIQGAKGAYEMILMAFETGDLKPVAGFLSGEVTEGFAEVIDQRASKGLKVEAQFLGVRSISLADATFDPKSSEAEISLRLQGEMTSTVRDASGKIVEGGQSEIKKLRDVWTFARVLGSKDPNWQLVATGE